MEAVSTTNLFKSNGKINWWGWIAFTGTLLIIGFTIYQWVESIRKRNREENYQMKKLMELEMNLKTILGDKYINLTQNNNNPNNQPII